MRIGFFGGTFDPIHRGHLDVAHAARRALDLDRVYFVPAETPPHRQLPQASSAHRFAMVALAVAPVPGFLVSDLEMRTDGPSYTSATLDRLQARGIDTTACCLITGADAFQEIGSWKDFPAILDRCHMVAVSRPTHPAPALLRILPQLAPRMTVAQSSAVTPLPTSPSIVLVDAPTAPVSSTEVRQRRAAHMSIAELVPSAVEEYIEKHDLYVERA